MAQTPGFKFLVQNSSNTSWTDAARGTLWNWGYNFAGAMGNGDASAMYSSPIQIGTLTNWKKVVGEDGQTNIAVKTDGTLWAWGWNLRGMIGNGTTLTYASPVQIGALTTWSDISIHNTNVRAIKTDGTLWSWGYNAYGYIGRGNTIDYSSPVQVGALTTWASLGGYHAIKTDGTLWGWGESIGNGTILSYSSPVQIGTATTWKQVSVNVAVRTDGTLWTWGDNGYGQLGNNDTGVSYSAPVQVGTLTTWDKVLSNGFAVFARKYDGTLWSWGYNFDGDLGNGTTIHYSSPVQIGTLNTWKDVYRLTGGSYGAIKTDGTLWTWGSSVDGELGNGTTLKYSSPVQVGAFNDWLSPSIRKYQKETYADIDDVLVRKDQFIDTGLLAWGNSYYTGLGVNISGASSINYNSPLQVGTLNNWKSIGAGNYNAAAIKYDGTLWGWGVNSGGELGNGTTIAYSSPIQIGNLNTWKSVGKGFPSGTLAIKTDGTMWMSGATGNYYLNASNVQVGFNILYSSPVQVGSGTNWASVQVYGGTNSGPLFALTTDGTLWGWGATGTWFGKPSGFYSSPIQIGSVGEWARIATTMSDGVTTYASHIMGIKKNGTLWAWGNNGSGQLGNGTTVAYISPIQVGSAADWADVTVGYNGVTAAVKKDGTLWCWGFNVPMNAYHILNGQPMYSSPVQIGALTNWKRVFTDSQATLAIKTDGTTWAWGLGTNGKFANVTMDFYQSGSTYSSPIQISSGVGWKDIAAGTNFVIAINS